MKEWKNLGVTLSSIISNKGAKRSLKQIPGNQLMNSVGKNKKKITHDQFSVHENIYVLKYEFL